MTLKTIKVCAHSKTCLSEIRGKELRGLIENALKEEQVVEIDFSNITLFAPSYFNPSLGYLLSKLGPQEYNERIKISNLSPVGQKIYKQVIENALNYYNSNKG